ncbi:PREDICTED: Fanconi anemia core complex-associated protein 100-like [Myotis brandtii]|uniref:Fanconi anemia core complex-associated protein 100-like n=1 Tax=Myotis brandtii TaxID=109478 RepID=UPI000704711A|nr:PREDICTED: Fanconi anemia core complex-associated protein 100-like [Myotis brandtii]
MPPSWNRPSAPGDPKALVRILHHLEEPVAFIGALRTEPSAEGPEDADLDCLVALGHHGRTLAIKASWDEAGSLVPELREYCLPGPVLCAACSGDSHVYHSTPSGLCVCRLDLSPEPPRPTRVTAADTGRKIKDLLCGIGTVSERVSSLKKAVDQRNRALTCLNEAMNVSCALLASREGARPVSCTTTTLEPRRETRLARR